MIRFITRYKSGIWVPLKPFTFIQALLSGNVYSWKVRFNWGDETEDSQADIPTDRIRVYSLELL